VVRGENDGSTRTIPSVSDLSLVVREIGAGSAADLVLLGFAPAFSSGDDMGVYIDVVNEYGADNTGATETSAQIMAAYNGAPAGSCLYLRGGTYKINPNVLNCTTRPLRLLAEKNVTLIANSAGGSGSYLLRVSVNDSRIQGVEIDCNSVVDDGIVLDPAHGTVVEDCWIWRPARYGIHNKLGRINLAYVRISYGKIGFYLKAPNGTIAVGCFADNTTDQGWWITGPGAGEVQSGSCSLLGCGTEFCNTSGTAESVLLDGVYGCNWTGGYWEADQFPILKLRNRAQVCTVRAIRGTANAPTTAPYLVEVYDSRCNTVEMSCAGDLSKAVREYVGDNAVPATNWDSFGNQYRIIREQGSWGAGVLEYGGIVLEDSSATTNTFRLDSTGALLGSGAPTIGVWRPGDFIRSNVAGSTFGWRCTVGGFPGTWVTV
jgi:hypothetical protein